ncbi:MAG TPA: response regulator [Phototrophicaceae bacterium]|nr:response regulator [Phototrophicaceae bacterium]
MAIEVKKRVLIVDDDPELQNLVKLLLERVSIEALPALNVASAVQVLRSKPFPDLVLLDLMLPDISGLELLRQIRAKEAFDQIPVIILSAMADPKEIRQGLELGADRYLTKPYIAHNLTKTVQEVLRIGRNKPPA